MIQRGLIHAMSGIADGQTHIVAELEARLGFNRHSIGLKALQSNFQTSRSVAHGMPGVGAEVHQDLVNLRGIGQDRGNGGFEVSFEFNGSGNRGPQQPE